jgi:AraC-like DNA-binding protein
MELEMFKWIVNSRFKLMDYNFEFFDGDKKVYSKEVIDEKIDLIPYAKKRFFNQAQSVSVSLYVTDSLLAFGYLKDKESNLSLIFGPALVGPYNESILKKIIVETNNDLLKADELGKILQKQRPAVLAKLQLELYYLNVVVNHEFISPSQGLAIDDYKTLVQENVYGGLVDANEYSGQDVGPQECKNNEDQMINYVISSDAGSLSMLSSEAKYPTRELFYSGLASDSIRAFKDRSISFISIVSRETINNGLDAMTAYTLNDLYISKIEQARDFNDIKTIQGAMMNDFAQRMKECHAFHTGNPTIDRAMICINNHLREKLSTEKIADILHITPSYLSTQFKKSAGISLHGYINKQKIAEAKKLLEMTDKPLSDISNYLSFSSQAYFQNIFKEVTGMTPKKYQTKYRVKNQDSFSSI